MQGVTDTWWMTNPPPPNAESFQMFQGQAQKVRQIVEALSPISPEIQKIAARFPRIAPLVWINGNQQILEAPGRKGELTISNSLGVCFMGEAAAREYGTYMPFWDHTRQIIIFPAIVMSDEFLAAFMCHELGHARRHHPVGGVPATPALGDAHVAEEVELHELTGLILNATSRGKYHRLLDEIILRNPAARAPDEALVSLEAKDCKVLDEMFGCMHSDLPSNMLISQALLEIGFRHCDKKKLGMETKMQLYRDFHSYFFTTRVGLPH